MQGFPNIWFSAIVAVLINRGRYSTAPPTWKDELMSTEMVIAAFDAAETDDRLNTLDKLLLLRVAWRSVPGKDYEIKFRTLARELGASRNGVRKSVAHLEALGYFYAVSVKVRPGPLLTSRKGSPSDPSAQKRTGHPVTPPGSPSDPSKGHPVTPLQRKEKKNAGARRAGGFSVSSMSRETRLMGRAPENQADGEGGAVQAEALELTGFQLSRLDRGESVLLADGRWLQGGSPEAEAARLAARRAKDAEKRAERCN